MTGGQLREPTLAQVQAEFPGTGCYHDRRPALSAPDLTIYPIDILDYSERVYTADSPSDRRPVIAVIGGGASGTLAAVHLLRLAAGLGRGGMRIALIDRLGRHGLGQAYSTTHPAHLLNSPAGKMSAVAGDPGHLLRWARGPGLAGCPCCPTTAARCGWVS
jgi:FAD-NAD(P)-binding